MAGLMIYGLCALTALLCAGLLLKTYRQRNAGLLFWSGMFFVMQAINNTLLILDKLVVPTVDLSLWRSTIALVAIAVLLYGLVMNEGEVK
jgi:hydrogenase/urease accessory protein HupE